MALLKKIEDHDFTEVFEYTTEYNLKEYADQIKMSNDISDIRAAVVLYGLELFFVSKSVESSIFDTNLVSLEVRLWQKTDAKA